jgi:WS/DGAT C-terminal domain
MIDLAALAPPVVAHAALERAVFSTRMFNLAVTNVPGSPVPLYAFGALLLEIHPVLPLLADHAVGIVALSYRGLVTFGINADASSTPTSTCSRAASRKVLTSSACCCRTRRDPSREQLTQRDRAADRRQRDHAVSDR